jgi:hypothetical protein
LATVKKRLAFRKELARVAAKDDTPGARYPWGQRRLVARERLCSDKDTYLGTEYRMPSFQGIDKKNF